MNIERISENFEHPKCNQTNDDIKKANKIIKRLKHKIQAARKTLGNSFKGAWCKFVGNFDGMI